jgi:hypothetical protein
VWGTVELSDGTRAEGWLSLAPGRPLEVFDLEAEEWREFAIDEILGLRATPRKEELEREWRWKEYGKDEKVYTGRAYPKRWLDHELVLGSDDEEGGMPGERIRCHVRGAAVYLTTEPDRPADGAVPTRRRAERERPAQRRHPRRRQTPPVPARSRSRKRDRRGCASSSGSTRGAGSGRRSMISST